MFKHIIDDHTELRLLEVRDAEALFNLTDTSRDHLRKWLPWVDYVRTAKDSKGFIEGALKQFGSNDGFQTGIWYKGELAGVIGLHAINWSNRATTIGYWIGDSFQGKGITTKSCEAVIHYCFKDLDLKRIEIRVATGNVKSKAIPERLGFEKEGCLRKCELLNGQYVDHFVYGLIN